MKTETQIAEEKLKLHKELRLNEGKMFCLKEMIEHKASCQRDIPKLEKIKKSIVYVENELCHHLIDEMNQEKKETIKE